MGGNSTDYYLILIWCFCYAAFFLLALGWVRRWFRGKKTLGILTRGARPLSEAHAHEAQDLTGKRFRVNHVVTLISTFSLFSISLLLLFISLGLSQNSRSLLENANLAVTVFGVITLISVAVAYLLRKGVYLELRKFVSRNAEVE